MAANPSAGNPTPSSPIQTSLPLTKDPVEFVVDHYQKTYELTHEFWKQRNNLFVILVSFLAAWTILLSLGQPQANSLLIVWFAKTIGETDPSKIKDLQNSVNFDLLQVLAMAVVFYLTVNLYHRTQDVLRLYKYLDGLEGEIRQRLQLPPTSIAFTRESTFYWKERPWPLAFVKVAYIIILSVLLGGFLWLRLNGDLSNLNPIKATDFILAAAIAIYLVSYILASKEA
jgi:hypothetical protein